RLDDAGTQLGRRHGLRGGSRKHHRSGGEIGQRGLALVAARLEVLLEEETILRVERPQGIARGEFEILVVILAHTHSCFGSSSRKRSSPCRVHDFTVPSGAPIRVATSLCDKPSK